MIEINVIVNGVSVNTTYSEDDLNNLMKIEAINNLLHDMVKVAQKGEICTNEKEIPVNLCVSDLADDINLLSRFDNTKNKGNKHIVLSRSDIKDSHTYLLTQNIILSDFKPTVLSRNDIQFAESIIFVDDNLIRIFKNRRIVNFKNFTLLMEEEINTEKIICAAVKVEETGEIFYGHRHYLCLEAMNGKLSWGLNREQIGKLKIIQGFITSENRFVDRKEALEIALKNNQVLDQSKLRGNDLYSEDLY